jgi:hypothetical protein
VIQEDGSAPKKVQVVLFKDNGKYYTAEDWEVPPGAIGPQDMVKSRQFRRIRNGPVLVTDVSPWGYPCLLMPSQ